MSKYTESHIGRAQVLLTLQMAKKSMYVLNEDRRDPEFMIVNTGRTGAIVGFSIASSVKSAMLPNPKAVKDLSFLDFLKLPVYIVHVIPAKDSQSIKLYVPEKLVKLADLKSADEHLLELVSVPAA